MEDGLSRRKFLRGAIAVATATALGSGLKSDVPIEKQKPRSDIAIVDESLKACAKLTNNPKNIEGVQAYLEEYFSEAIANTEIYSSEKFAASFPYTVVRLRELAQALHAKFGTSHEQSAAQKEVLSSDRAVSKKEIIFGTFFDVNAGHPYHWIERGIDQLAQKLPEAMRRIENGETVEDVEVYGVGSPAGELGTTSSKFVDSAADHPFEHCGDLYAEFVHSLEANRDKSTSSRVRLWGHSMGASLAATTGESLIRQNFASQSPETASQESLPLIQIQMHAPVAATDSAQKRWQIPVGIAAEFVMQKLAGTEYDNSVAGAERDFITGAYKQLSVRGIVPHITDTDLLLKNALISKSIEELRNGIPIPKNVKVHDIIGTSDPLMYSGDFNKRAELQRAKHKGSLAAYTVKNTDSNRTQFAINTSHAPSVVRENYFKRLLRAGSMLRQK